MNLVFASGFLVPQEFADHGYFRDLRSSYPQALFATVNVLGSIADRAGELAAAIAKQFPAGDIHIVAHSMGGLDSRYLIAKNLNNLTSRIRSLSTISTPHWGSPVADLLAGQAAPPLLSVLAEKALALLFAKFPALQNSSGAVSDLTTRSAQQFNQDFPADPGVSYYPYAANGHGSTLLIPANLFIGLIGGTPLEKENDGVVSVASATWPGPFIEPHWNTDHFGEIGYDLDRPGFQTTFPYKVAINRVITHATS
jgi:triacylglycerol lipase